MKTSNSRKLLSTHQQRDLRRDQRTQVILIADVGIIEEMVIVYHVESVSFGEDDKAKRGGIHFTPAFDTNHLNTTSAHYKRGATFSTALMDPMDTRHVPPSPPASSASFIFSLFTPPNFTSVSECDCNIQSVRPTVIPVALLKRAAQNTVEKVSNR
ncbi:hypothetical protein EPUL_006092 [Erysiphe pulchra]|uniref:Uncharacterized protein n=1 Tax=Erysiphe pulchra TaxID=225359 RepID=A0A2S4PL51_9PEZI|nr:hypothetical protein EPUL_006092 [Erysiphe pulchra]